MAVAPRPLFHWKLRTRSLPLGTRTQIVGVLNVTPDSFSDGGLYFARESAIEHALRLLDEGADILDIGGESTRPGDHPPLSAQQEIDRVVPIIAAVLQQRPQAILSIDTYKAQTAQAAVSAGAEIVNDVSGFLWDHAMAATCASLGCGVLLMHTRGRPQEWRAQPPIPPQEIVPLVLRELAQRAQSARDAGVHQENIVLDPGLGFGKIGEENYPLLANFDRLHALGYPLLVGASRKSFLTRTIQQATDQEPSPDARLHGTLAAHTAAILAGAHLIRVHDVAAARDAAAVADAIRAAAKILHP
ncbi:MAG TPA: dihydropteroate synthase [Acidobacteriaceae bacterium]|jgi:dihydropteroate synthase|nr:dihydropteroate synthase [Acidobacteriaceae bacterium]